MITQYRPANYTAPRASEFIGRSIDTKPIDVENGSMYTELDTGRIYRFDAENKQWREQKVSPSAGVTVEAITITTNGTITAPNGKAYSPITVNVPTSGVTPGDLGDITFYDYDGTIVTSWSLAELATKTALPDFPTHDGLTCQGWNWSLEDLKVTNRRMNVGATYIPTDGSTRIHIRLEEGRTSPILGVCPNGTVTVDWGDGTTTDTLTGTDTTAVQYTPTHKYAAPGDYIIKLTVDGEFGIYSNGGSAILRSAVGEDASNYAYQNAVRQINFGSGITSIPNYATMRLYNLQYVSVPNSLLTMNLYAFQSCYNLKFIVFPNGTTTINNSNFNACYSLTGISFPNGITTIMNNAFNNCYSLRTVTFPTTLTSIRDSAFANCNSLSSIDFPPDLSMRTSLTFMNCYGVKYYDFTRYTSVPELYAITVFSNMASDCEIRVPASLLDDWKAARNWSNLADHIVGV